jgi:adenylosuccinate lyase
MIEPALLNNTLWDERDLTNSSSERIIFPESTVLTDHILQLTNRILRTLRFYPENIKRNLGIMKGLNMAEAVMINLTRKGVSRQRSHELLRTCAMRAKEGGKTLLEELLEEDEIAEHFTRDELEEIIKPENYIGTAVEKVEAVVEKLRE